MYEIWNGHLYPRVKVMVEVLTAYFLVYHCVYKAKRKEGYGSE